MEHSAYCSSRKMWQERNFYLQLCKKEPQRVKFLFTVVQEGKCSLWKMEKKGVFVFFCAGTELCVYFGARKNLQEWNFCLFFWKEVLTRPKILITYLQEGNFLFSVVQERTNESKAFVCRCLRSKFFYGSAREEEPRGAKTFV